MSKHEDADLILKLYDLRREATMREARNWLFTFNPTSVQDIIDVLLGEHSGQPVLEEARALFGNPDFLRNLQTLVERIPNHAETISAMRERMKKFAEMRAERVAKSQSATSAS